MTILRQHNNFTYRFELAVIRLRDLLRPPAKVLAEAGMQAGMTVLDFGCGPGGFSLAAAKLVGTEGRVYAVDIQPMAVESVRRAAIHRGLGNITVIPGDHLDEVPAQSVDLVLFYDILHCRPFPEWMTTLTSIHHMLKPQGMLSIRDHHLKKNDLVSPMDGTGLFRFVRHGRWSSLFKSIGTARETL